MPYPADSAIQTVRQYAAIGLYKEEKSLLEELGQEIRLKVTGSENVNPHQQGLDLAEGPRLLVTAPFRQPTNDADACGCWSQADRTSQ